MCDEKHVNEIQTRTFYFNVCIEWYYYIDNNMYVQIGLKLKNNHRCCYRHETEK